MTESDQQTGSGKKSFSDGLLIASNSGRVSRDEMNLAEFPLTVLSTRAEPNVKTLEFSDSIRGKNGELVSRQWIITAADKFGLPTCSDDEVLLGLLKLSVDEGFKNPKVFFSRYELLRILRWSTEGRSYSRLQKALDRLSGVRIKASNAFFDNDSKSHSTRNFGLIDAYEINDGRNIEAKPSFFIWSEVLFKSFQVGFIKKFDLDFYLELKSAVSKRLFRYLDKHFWYRSKIQMNLFTLAHEKIGISRNYKYASSLRQQIDPAAEELVACGFLERFEYVGKGSTTELVLYAGRGKPRFLDNNKPNDLKTETAHSAESTGRNDTQRKLDLGTEHEAEPLGQKLKGAGGEVSRKLVERGIKLEQAQRLVSTKTEKELEKVIKIIEYFDSLVSSQSKLVSKSPLGFLFRAVEKSAEFGLPQNESRQVTKKVSGATKTAREIFRPQTDPQKEEYERYRRAELEKLWETTERSLIQKLHVDAERTLARIREIISEEGFRQTVTHKVEEMMCNLFVIPTFDEWKKKRK
jgi:hypothetical protein